MPYSVKREPVFLCSLLTCASRFHPNIVYRRQIDFLNLLHSIGTSHVRQNPIQSFEHFLRILRFTLASQVGKKFVPSLVWSLNSPSEVTKTQVTRPLMVVRCYPLGCLSPSAFMLPYQGGCTKLLSPRLCVRLLFVG